jgi:type I restriction enzyme S subunit
LSAADLKARLRGFAVRRGQVLRRADVSYNLLTEEVNRRLANPRFPLTPISAIEVLLQYGCSKRATEEAVGYRILRMNNLQAEGWALDELKYVELTPAELATWRLERGDIIFNRTNSKELVGKCEVFDEDGDWVFASYLMRLRVEPKRAVPRFVTAFLNTRAGRIQIDRESRQIIGMANINAEEIRTLRIPLPDPGKQEELRVALDAAHGLRGRKLREADEIVGGLDAFVLDQVGLSVSLPDGRLVYAARLKDARGRFDADYHSPRFRALREKMQLSKHLSRTIKSLCGFAQSGFAAGGDDQTDDPESGVAHIRPLNISNTGELHFQNTKMVPRSAVEPNDFLTKGEVLFNNTNSTAWVGKSVVFDSDRDCACSNHITRLRLADKADSPYLLAALLNALRGLGYFALLSTNFNNQAGINVETLNAVRIPWPKPEVQARIAAEVARRREGARRLRDEAERLWEQAKEEFESALLGPETTERAPH